MYKWDPAKRLGFIAEKIQEHNEAQNRKLADEWKGLAFICHNESFIIPLEYVIEIVSVPPLSLIPGAKSWFLGIGNLRGDMLPIVDLQDLLFSIKTPIEKYTPVLVIQHQGELSGILVNKVTALYSMPQKSSVPFSLLPDSAFFEYISEGIEHNQDFFPVFDISKLIDNPVFSNIALSIESRV